ncbi:hypothetical protein bpr_I2182 [Butyrivibrio proteoclasticus B316]|uniref:DUF5672 domain-containing protein n=1 Tax=Butyrivibrio proteoclasticus (strain ATCC 51982 / DSM 14932 / B316) TaxID=515622 RepID=E0RX07_BUTPB|nr:DUF5672 family protein [Butyrivibrio proteoclasticus]ADL34915.1 hypothetical protein bpr_I2182 [Butyrivibrio proteoclasticus B316]
MIENNVDNVAIIVPVYSKELTQIEKIALIQLKKTLNRYPIIFIAPESLDLSGITGITDMDFVQRLPNNFFENVESYNELCLSRKFYELFLKYEYLLFYQLDAFVFEDQLIDFVNLGYDYIGAPWLRGYCNYAFFGRNVFYVGNGGLSLRKTSKMIEVLEKYEKEKVDCYINEDVIFASYKNRGLNIAPIEVALKFSFEGELHRCLAENRGVLPFGCHAWYKTDLKFWKPYIEKYGYILPKDIPPKQIDMDSIHMYKWMEKNSLLLKDDEKFFSLNAIINKRWPDLKESRLFLWGAGFYGKHICEVLKQNMIRLDGFLDSDLSKIGRQVCNMRVFPIEELENGDKIIVTAAPPVDKSISHRLTDIKCNIQIEYATWDELI